ncbi:mobA/MobL family protein [Streptococcus pneumoniae GA13723]|nr:mobA/MobL family protein [Streptococcus pneumoniae GA13723]
MSYNDHNATNKRKRRVLSQVKKEYILDEKGEKVLNKNGKPKTRKVELTTWNDTGNVEKWRENFSDLCNKYLERAGAEKRVDHRVLKDKIQIIYRQSI